MDRAVTDSPQNTTTGSGDVWTVRRMLEWTTSHLQKHGSETPRLDAEILLAHARGCRRIELYTRFDDNVNEQQRAVMRDLVKRRAKAEPVAYLVGFREFYGLDFRVTPDVLIPRPDTETLVLELLEIIKPMSEPRILDLCTGSGCIAVATAVNKPSAQLTAVDISSKALEVAQFNAEKHNVADRIRFLEGDLFEPLEAGARFDIVASNPPYVAEKELDTLQPDVRLHEPRLALDGGPGGLKVLRRLAEDTHRYLLPGGHLLFEIAPEQADAVLEMLDQQGSYTNAGVKKDLAGHKRVVHAQRKA
jgi:release factor glutamine methyltransferase